ncbi:MAG TPA: hypothetical protein VFW19_01050 [Allosphingosinicella sp.]|nr:hypothetical protein [Allosphingosinicella sp.]
MRDTEARMRGIGRRRIPARTVLALGLAALAGAAVAVPVRVAVPKDDVDPLRAGVAAAERGDCAEAGRQLRPLTEAKIDATRMDEAQATAFESLVSCEAEADRDEEAYADALAATRIGRATGYLWQMRLILEVETRRAEAGAATAETMPKVQSEAFASLDVSLFDQLDALLKDKGLNARRERLLELLLSDAWKPDDGPTAKDGFRLRRAQLAAARPDGQAEARAALAEVKDPYWLQRIAVDPTLRALLPAPPDLRAATEAMLKLDQEAAAAHPDRLRPLTIVSGDLRALGRPEEALRLLQGMAARVQDPIAFSDRDRAVPWWWDEIGRSEEALGHYDAAAAAFRQGMALPEAGQPNFSQTINLADLQTRFGHARDALKTLAVFADPKRKGSPYGEMMLRESRGCAYAALGETREAAADVAYARAHEKDAPNGLADLLLCTGDVSGAAAIILRELADPEERPSALLQFCDFADPPVRLPPSSNERAWQALKARPDIKAAIARAGGTRRFNIVQDDI